MRRSIGSYKTIMDYYSIGSCPLHVMLKIALYSGHSVCKCSFDADDGYIYPYFCVGAMSL